jgi:hypothetical protein
VLLIAVLVVNLFQAYYTGIISDEAYYELYGEHLSWGYFDHPPLVAILTWVSSILFSGTLGIRFITTLVYVFTIYIIWKVVDEKHPDTNKVLFFFLVVSSFALFTVYGFVTTPDVPLLFFVALFLYLYKQFLKEASLKIAFFLGIAMAGLVYSKYQASLVIGLVILSNIRLLGNGKFWFSAVLGLVLLIPHFYWQYDHDFPTFDYHLIDRAGEFTWQYIIGYIPNTFVAFNPFAFVAILYILIKYRPGDLFERALYFLIIGFLLFFWATGFRGHVQPQWNVAATIPMIIILYNRIQENKKLKDYSIKFILPSVFLLMVARILIAENNFIASKCSFEKENPRMQLISKVAGELPVVFLGSFQDPSRYHYFTSKKAFTLSSLEGRYTQFDMWQWEKQYHNKPVFVCSKIIGRSKKITDGDVFINGFVTGRLQTVNRMIVDFELPETLFQQGDTIVMQISINNPYPYTIDFHHTQFPVNIIAVFINKSSIIFQPVAVDSPIGLIGAGKSKKSQLKFTIPKLKAGKYQFGFSLKTSLSKPMNSKLIRINVR